jgi:hypothetical protein
MQMQKVMPSAKDKQAKLLSKPAVSPQELHKSETVPISLNGIYEACKSGEIESFRIGKKIFIPTAPLRKKLGIEAA